jgi:hypothetical protein
MEGFHRRPALIAAMLILAGSLAGMLLVGYATAHGPGVGGDATIYLLSAENLLAGNGLGWMEPGGFHRLDYYPPFFPQAVSVMSLFVGDVVAAARWLNMLLFGSLIALSGAWLYHATHRPLLAGMLSGMLAVSPVLIRVFSWAMAEALFLLTGFGGLALLAQAKGACAAGRGFAERIGVPQPLSGDCFCDQRDAADSGQRAGCILVCGASSPQYDI